VTLPGVSLTAACFPQQRYEDAAAARCFSNLLATGFRRFEVDLYWDPSRRVWSLCPFELGGSSPSSNTTGLTSFASSQTSLATLASGSLTGQPAVKKAAHASSRLHAHARQASDVLSGVPTDTAGITGSSFSVSVTTTISVSSASTSTLSNARSSSSASTSASSQGTLIQAGPYSCTLGVDLDTISTVLAQYLSNTETDLNATTRIITLNLHAAAMASDPAGGSSQPSSDALPRENNLLSSIISTNNSVYLYTPSELLSQRANLNATGNWFAVSRTNRPNDAYFSIEQIGSTDSSANGWPSESYVELQKAKRLLVGFGTIDPQMRAYNFSGDEGLIFPAGYLSSAAQLSISMAGEVIQGCFYNTAAHSIGQSNNSWALSSIASTSTFPILNEVGNVTACGTSPFLNRTLDNTDAGTNYGPYQDFVYAHIWSWHGKTEPRYSNVSSKDNGQEYSCAAMNATSAGWQAANCNSAHYGACRVGNSPYDWRITGQEGIYRRIDAGCPEDTTFDVPRTALENTYLLNTWRDHLRSNDDPDANDQLLWVNFNDLDTSACWVIGQNATCPYQPGDPVDEGRAIIVPTVAGIVVLVLAVLTIFTKCAANRQNLKRRRRRADDGWDYEGVPS